VYVYVILAMLDDARRSLVDMLARLKVAVI